MCVCDMNGGHMLSWNLLDSHAASRLGIGPSIGGLDEDKQSKNLICHKSAIINTFWDIKNWVQISLLGNLFTASISIQV